MDVSRVAAPADREHWWQLMTSLVALTPTTGVIIPALAEGDPDEAWEAAAPLASLAGRAALRVSLPHPAPVTLAGTMANAAACIGLPASAIDVVLDWGDEMEATAISLDTLVAHTQAAMITAGTPEQQEVRPGRLLAPDASGVVAVAAAGRCRSGRHLRRLLPVPAVGPSSGRPTVRASAVLGR